MRKFTKTHNDLKWLFPVAKKVQEAYIAKKEESKTIVTGLTESD